MVIQEGYKQTEIGVIPMDWEVKTLGELFEFKNGLNKEKHFFGYGTPILNYMDVFNYSGIQSNDIKGKVFLTNPEIKTYEVKKGDVFFTRTSETVEEIGITTVVLENVVDTVFSGFVLRGRPKNSILDLYFKKYCFSSNFVRKEIISTASYTTRALTNGRLLANVKIIVPHLAEQTAIATALSDADGLITGLEKLLAKKRNIKQGAMQQLLQPKEGWEVKKLGECLLKNPDYGINAAAVEYNDNLPTYLRITDISENGKYLTTNKASVDNILSNSYYLEEGDIVFARTGASVGKTYLYNKNDGELVFAGFLIRVKANPEMLDYNYLFFLTQTKSYWDWVKANSMRSGQPGLNSNEYKSFEIPFPPKEEQTRIATILSDMDAELSALEKKLEKYKKIKLGMMQELLTGKTRLV